jgi:chaperonin cofactor prefoldin
LNDIPEYLANIRLMINAMVEQLDKVHRSCCLDELDLETVMLNVSDLRDQMNDIRSELQDMKDEITTQLEAPSEEDD